jgi:hypothetical protein
MEVSKAPFFVEKLAIKILPCVISFKDGIVVDRLVGFEPLGNEDNFPTSILAARFAMNGVLGDIHPDDIEED